ncbi:MAG: hypothetical protein R3F37_00060 [Candidatus Competibacteraceae bacterium]
MENSSGMPARRLTHDPAEKALCWLRDPPVTKTWHRGRVKKRNLQNDWDTRLCAMRSKKPIAGLLPLTVRNGLEQLRTGLMLL